MRRLRGVVGATLLYGPNDPVPDLVPVMQFLVDDLRAEERPIFGLRLGAKSLRLRTDGFDLAVTHAHGPLPPEALVFTRCLPAKGPDAPDLVRARLSRNLRDHRHAMGFIVRQRGALTEDSDALARALTKLGRRCLLPVFEAAPPCLLVWQPGGLLFTPAEFMDLDLADLIASPDSTKSALISGGVHRRAARPNPGVRPMRPTTDSRAIRADKQSAGRLFGYSQSLRPRVFARPDTDDPALKAALRTTTTTSPAPIKFRLQRIVVAALWIVLLPQILASWLLV